MSGISLYSPTENSAQLISQVEQYLDEGGVGLVWRALDLAVVAHDGFHRMSGVPYINHAVAVAEILASWYAPAEVVAAGLLHDVAKENYSNVPASEEIESVAGEKVVQIVQQVARLGRLGPVYHRREDNIPDGGTDDFANLLPWATQVLEQEPAAIIVKIADRLDNFRTLNVLQEDRAKKFAQGTRNVFIPFAERLGMRQTKRALEDNAFRILQHEAYQHIVQHYPSEACEAALSKVLTSLREQFAQHDLLAEVSCAPYSYYELYRLETQQTKSVKSKLPPILVMVADKSTCYQALGIIHLIWRPRSGGIQDFIAAPKVNGYRALHTSARSGDGNYSLVLIRDPEMHLVAEYGITAKWQGVREEVLPQLPAWQEPPAGMIAVFTPDGELINLPEGACPVDFAYHIHPELGHQCSGAIVNGQQVALDTSLKTGDVVKILTSAASVGPSLQWLKYVKSHRAQREIRRWTKERNPAEASVRGRNMLDNLLREQGVTLSTKNTKKTLATVTTSMHYATTEDLFVAVGLGQRSAESVIKQFFMHAGKDSTRSQQGATIVSLAGSNLPQRFAKCCSPRPPDSIVGYITKDQRVSIHRADCHIIHHLRPLVAAEWNVNLQQQITEIKVVAVDRPGLVVDVSNFILQLGLSMASFHADRIGDGSARIQIDLDKPPIESFNTLLEGLQAIRDVRQAHATDPSLPSRFARGAVVERHIRNPYNLNPVSGPDFYGRKKELFELVNNLRDIRPGQAVLVWGPRRIGKTSLLLQFQRSILNREDYAVAYLNLHQLSGRTTTEFLRDILKEIAVQVQQKNIVAPKLRRMQHEPLGYFDSFIGNALPKSQKHIVLLFDEFQFIPALREEHVTLADINRYFRSLIQRGVGITVLFSGGGVLADLRQQSGATNLLEVARFQKIGRLGDEDARSLITEPVTRIAYNDDVVDRLVKLTSGHPYFLQLLCGELLFHTGERSQITSGDLNQYMEQSWPQQAEHYFSHLWGDGVVGDRSIRQRYKLALVAAATATSKNGWTTFDNILQTGAAKNIGEQSLWRALQDLTEMDTLECKGDDDFRVCIELCQLWIQNNYSVKRVLREMPI